MKYVFRRFGKLIFPSKYQIIDVYSSINFTIKKYQTLITMDKNRAFSTFLVFPSWQKKTAFMATKIAPFGEPRPRLLHQRCVNEKVERARQNCCGIELRWLLWWQRRKRCRRLDSNASRKSEKERERERERGMRYEIWDMRYEIWDIGKRKSSQRSAKISVKCLHVPLRSPKPPRDMMIILSRYVSVCLGSIVMFSRTLPFSSFLQ